MLLSDSRWDYKYNWYVFRLFETFVKACGEQFNYKKDPSIHNGFVGEVSDLVYRFYLLWYTEELTVPCITCYTTVSLIFVMLQCVSKMVMSVDRVIAARVRGALPVILACTCNKPCYVTIFIVLMYSLPYKKFFCITNLAIHITFLYIYCSLLYNILCYITFLAI